MEFLFLGMLSKTEENYLKAIYTCLYAEVGKKLGTNELADFLSLTPATVTSMLKKLKIKSLVDYKKYGSISLTPTGKDIASQVIRKHRLWETFLYERLDFSWDEVHEVAEQLEHIHSKKLIEKLEEHLGFPEYDPHGDPIPRSDGSMPSLYKKKLSESEVGVTYRIVAVKDASASFLQYASELGIGLNLEIELLEKRDFDESLKIKISGKESNVSKKFGDNIFVV